MVLTRLAGLKHWRGGLKDRSQGLLGVRKATAGRPAALCVADGPIKRYFSPLFSFVGQVICTFLIF